MRNFILVLCITISMLSCKTETKNALENKTTETEQKQETPKLTLGEYNTKAGDFVDKEVQLSGLVNYVCTHSGKKLFIVSDEGDASIFSEEPFDVALKGSEITVNGIVVEERIDEGYLLKWEEDNDDSYSKGNSNKEQFENIKKFIKEYRDTMKADSVDHISNYSLKYISHTEID